MLQLLVVYFGPFFIFGMQITPSYRLKAVLIGFALNYAAYFAEIYRSGIAAIPVGQYEAARLLGYSKTQTFVHIVMPQVIKRIIPPVANETITLVKDTSLAFTLAVAEVFTVTKQLVASQSSVVPFIVAGIFVFAAAAFGGFKFKYVLNRMHVAAKCDSLGALLILVGCMILGGFSFMTLKLLLVLLILWITSPVAAHLIVKAEVKTQDEDESDEYEVIGK